MTLVGQRLENALTKHQGRLRHADEVMAPATLGAARLTRYSFSRMLLRRAFADGWQAQRSHFQIDAEGRGEAAYEVSIDGMHFHFVAFTTTLDESQHTDRVVANNWEITGALIEGELTDEIMALLRSEVPQQEDGRLDSRILVLTRGNRSVRFFEYIVDRLAAGEQPDSEHVGDAGYIMRSTAFYGNGKYGMRSFDGYPPQHPLGVPYRAQILAAWLFRELSYDVVEHCARLRGGSAAVGFDEAWKRFFGLGNATGLGLVPYAMKHPRVIHAWVGVRELALAKVRELPATPARTQLLDAWIDRAREFFVTGTDDDCHPFLNAQQLVPVIDQIQTQFNELRTDDLAFDGLMQWAQTQQPELTELVVSLLIELHEGNDDEIDEQLRVEEHASMDPTLTVGRLLPLVDERFGWIDDLGLDRSEANHFWWLVSDNTEEPRRAPTDRLATEGRDVAIDIAMRVWRLRQALQGSDSTDTLAAFLSRHPQHRHAVERVVVSDVAYGEPRDNVCDAAFLPLQLQRFQLAMYGMDNFKPKSTDWLRVTLYQGAPRLADLTDSSSFTDRWALPPRPATTAPQTERST